MRRSNKNKIIILFGVAIIITVAGFLAGVFFDKAAPDQSENKNRGAVDLVRPPFLDE